MSKFNQIQNSILSFAIVSMITTITPVCRADEILFEPAKPTTKVDSCITSGCHTKITDRKFMHAPVSQGKCLECHEYAVPEEHLFVLSKLGGELCVNCHTQTHTDRVIHKPVADGLCLSCHDPHGSEHKSILRKDPAKGLCLDCHKDDYSKHQFVHGPVAVGACVVCHEAHSSSYKNLLSDRPDKLCLNCHEELNPSDAEKRHLHKPLSDGCISCHNPHASENRFQLEDAVPDLCIKCHDWVPDLIKSSPDVHAPFKDPGGCTQCHNPHFSTLSKLQRETQPALCLKCHDKPVKANDGHMLIDMKTFLKENPDHHGPIREGGCTMCHHPHASENQRLLVKTYPKEFYTSFAIEKYQLCFTCHQSDLVTEESGTGLTNFRQGDKNLHWVHVNQEKGRTCRACHEVHASKRPDHIRESVPFGSKGWMLDINFTKMINGGSCAPACHKAKTYSRIASSNDPAEQTDSPVTNNRTDSTP